jgi:hypothetical protein
MELGLKHIRPTDMEGLSIITPIKERDSSCLLHPFNLSNQEFFISEDKPQNVILHLCSQDQCDQAVNYLSSDLVTAVPAYVLPVLINSCTNENEFTVIMENWDKFMINNPEKTYNLFVLSLFNIIDDVRVIVNIMKKLSFRSYNKRVLTRIKHQAYLEKVVIDEATLISLGLLD